LKDLRSQVVSLFETAGPALHALLTRLTLREDAAEELMQDLFINLSQSRAFGKATNPGGYAYRTAINLAFAWRRSRKQGAKSADLGDIPAGETESPLAKLAVNEELQRMLQALGRLPEPQRTAVVMRYIQQESDEAISEQIGRPPQHVRALRHRAITSLRRLLREEIRPPAPKETTHARYGRTRNH